VDFAESIGHVPSVGHALWWAAMVHQFRRDAPPVLDHSERLLALGAEHTLKQYQMIGSIAHGWAFAHLSDIEEGLSELRHADISYAGTQKTYFRAILAETELRAGHFDRAEAALKDAAAIANRLDETWWRAGMLCIEGDLLRAQSGDSLHEAEERYRKAVALAVEQEAKSLELRAATRLARLCQGQGRNAEARDLLAPVYDWFTEGFETLDLKDAKALLEAL
jgi:predicted ATPase